MKISATIITLNEQRNIARAVSSLDFVDEIIIVDSFSRDKTAEIAKELGAKVVEHDFLGYGQQKNYAASLCQGEWILNIDADEEVSDELKNEILNIVNSKESKAIYMLNRKTNYCGKWIAHGGWYPNFVARLYPKDQAKWSEPHVHEDLFPTNSLPLKKLKGHLFHYSFPTISSQIRTNLRYSELAAKDLVKRKGRRPYIFELILRPIGKFFECYGWKLGFLDGKEGFIIAVNAMHAMFMKYSMAYLNKEEHY
jgi:glycosyltransferase involved in cell wall biosynthesis